MKAMEEALINVPDSWIVQGRLRAGIRLPRCSKFYHAVASPTAVFCGGDITRRWARFAAADEMGLRVPPGRFGDRLLDNVRRPLLYPRR
ncbi:hypothetical protein KCP74_19050 [Salmonella enterica subsp. enterica]|nr:hypothetical protein KCP74_19050 [Salmonella enterica subsp. enterica]